MVQAMDWSRENPGSTGFRIDPLGQWWAFQAWMPGIEDHFKPILDQIHFPGMECAKAFCMDSISSQHRFFDLTDGLTDEHDHATSDGIYTSRQESWKFLLTPPKLNYDL